MPDALHGQSTQSASPNYSRVKRWPLKLWVCPKGHVETSTLRGVCWACYPGGNGPAEQVDIEVVPLEVT